MSLRSFKPARWSTYGWPVPHPDTAVYLSAMAEMERLEGAAPQEIAAFQTAELRALLKHARQRSAFWAARARGIRAWDELPILTRAALAEQVAAEGALAAPDHGDPKQGSTSGSSGHAVAFHATQKVGYLSGVRYDLDHFAQGRDPARKLAVSRYNIEPGEHPRWPSLGKHMETGACTYANHTRMTADEVAAWLRGSGAAYLLAPAPVLDLLLAAWTRDPAAAPRLEQVATYAYNVTPDIREAVRTFTGARITDRYSSEEVGPIAFQCPRHDDAYHVATSNVLLEVVDAAGQPAVEGSLGRVLISALHNHATPFLRYELGDLAAMRMGCACGHRGPVLTALAGRARSLLRVGPGEYRSFTIRARDWLAAAPVREYRVTQAGEARLEAEVVADAPLDEPALARLRSLVAANCPSSFEVVVRQVEAIDWGPSYKRLEFRCLVD